MQKTTYFLNVVLIGFLILSCSSSSSLKNGIDNTYSKELGYMPVDKVNNFLNQVLVQRQRFEISRNEQYSASSGFYVETFWKERDAFESEKELGYSKVQVQLILTSKAERGKSATSSISSVVYVVDGKVTQQGLNSSTNQYEDFTFTREGKDYVKDILNDLKDFISGSMLR
jgi:hypothetical protein